MSLSIPPFARSPETTFVACFALALAACGALWLAYPYAIITPDTYGYMRLAQVLAGGGWTEDAARAVGLPLFLIVALQSGQPAIAVFWMNALAFGAAIGLCAWVVHIVFGGMRAAILSGAFLILLEFLLMEPFFSVAFVLPDLLLCAFLTAGTLLAYGGWAGRSPLLILAAGLLLGMSDLFRPMHATLIVWTCAACAFLIFSKEISRRVILGFLALLLAPTVAWTMWTHVAYPDSSDGIPSLHLSTHAAKIWSPDDALFDDPAVNDAFFRALETPDARTLGLPRSAFGHDPANLYGKVYGFIGSQTEAYKSGTPDFYLYRKQSADIAWTISTRAILLHPFAYALNVARNYWTMFDSYQLHSYPLEFFGPDARYAYRKMEQSRSLPIAAPRAFFGPTGKPDLSGLRTTVTAPVLAAVQAADLRTVAGRRVILLPVLAHAAGLLGLLLLLSPAAASALEWPRSRARLAGALLLTLFLTASSYAGAIAVITSHNESRYAVPYLLCLHLLLLSGAIVAARYAERFFARLFLHAE